MRPINRIITGPTAAALFLWGMSVNHIQAQISSTYCPDIAIKSVSIAASGKSKKYTLSVSIANIGSTDAKLRGDDFIADDDAGWQLYLSSDERWNGGDILVAGDYFQTHLLLPKQEAKETFDIKITEQSTFMRYLIFCFDPTEQLMECDETNNRFSVPLPKK